jgi:hypothetical protein
MADFVSPGKAKTLISHMGGANCTAHMDSSVVMKLGGTPDYVHHRGIPIISLCQRPVHAMWDAMRLLIRLA